jgi:hypothetical protein
MKKIRSARSGFVLVFLLLFLYLPQKSPAQKATQLRAVGVNPQINLPIGNLGNWYQATPGIGLAGQFFVSPALHIEVQYAYIHYSDGSVAKNSFQWPVDKKYYFSPQANAEMDLHTFTVNFLFRRAEKQFLNRRFVPFLMVGSGFYAFNNAVSGLIYPGQGTRPLNTSLLLPDTGDEQVAVGASLGAGFEHPLFARVDLDFRVQYHLILGNIRSFEDWGMAETFPLQMINFEIGIRYQL